MQDNIRIYGWLIPIFCTLTSGWMIYREQCEFSLTTSLRDKARMDAQQALLEKKTIDSLPIEKQYATVPETQSEEYDFVTLLKSIAAQNRVAVRNWTNDNADLGYNPKDKNSDPALKEIKKINTAISLVGSYENLRSMMSTLENSDRLLALTNLTWTRSAEGASLTCTVSRFVLPKKAKEKKASFVLTTN